MKASYLIIILILLIIVLGFSSYYPISKKELIPPAIDEYIVEEVEEKGKEPAIIFEQPQRKEAIVAIEYLKFVPNELNITPGTTVVWINKDTKPHQVYANMPGTPFISGRLQAGERYEYKFTELGIYKYTDGIFKSMKGKIRVIGQPQITGSFTGPKENQSATGILMMLVIFIFLGAMFEIYKK